MVVLYIILGITFLLVIFVVFSYNSLVSLRNKVKDQWSQIDVQLKRRFDLIPNLIETVKGYAKHEKETLENVIEARNKFSNASTSKEEMEASGELSGALSRLMAVAESYPDLKANAGFISLQETLSDTEDKIAFARQFYNDNVLSLNNKIEMFPSNVIASMFKFTKEPFFEVKETEKEAPKVKF
ncbi:MAG: LemA family protein [Bacilli bacterium]